MQHQDMIKNQMVMLILYACSLHAQIYQFHLSDRWYPSNKKKLHKALNVLGQQDNKYANYDFSHKNVVAFIVPDAAYEYSGALAVHLFKQLSGNSFDRIIILGSSNDPTFRGIALPGLAYKAYKTPLGIINLDQAILSVLAKKKTIFFPQHEMHELEHTIEVQLPLVQHYCNACKIIPMIVGSLTMSEIDQTCDYLKPYITNKTLVIVSSDLVQCSQNSYKASLLGDMAHVIEDIDNQLIEKIKQQDLQEFLGTIDHQNIVVRGKNALSVLLRLMQKKIINVQNSFVLGHEYCYMQQGNVQHCVSYVGMIMT